MVFSVLATFSVVTGASTTFVSTRSAVVSTLAVVAAVVSRLDALSALASSAKAGFAIKAKLARAVAHEPFFALMVELLAQHEGDAALKLATLGV